MMYTRWFNLAMKKARLKLTGRYKSIRDLV